MGHPPTQYVCYTQGEVIDIEISNEGGGAILELAAGRFELPQSSLWGALLCNDGQEPELMLTIRRC